MHVEELSLRSDSNLDDGIKGIPARDLVIVTIQHREGLGLQARFVWHS